MPSRSCFFHWLIWTGWTWNCLASSAMVLACLAASRATWALKAGECLLRIPDRHGFWGGATMLT